MTSSDAHQDALAQIKEATASDDYAHIVCSDLSFTPPEISTLRDRRCYLNFYHSDLNGMDHLLDLPNLRTLRLHQCKGLDLDVFSAPA